MPRVLFEPIVRVLERQKVVRVLYWPPIVIGTKSKLCSRVLPIHKIRNISLLGPPNLILLDFWYLTTFDIFFQNILKIVKIWRCLPSSPYSGHIINVRHHDLSLVFFIIQLRPL
jgi:hypothetical protein